MRVIHGLRQIKKFKKPVVALGVFDGVHRGHSKILRAAVKQAHRIKGTSLVVTFWPHPQKEESLYALEHRLKLLSDLGLDVCLVINFNPRFARISADNFVKNFLVQKIGTHYLYVGKNFRFGRQAEGNIYTLKKLAKKHSIHLKIFKVIKVKNKPISSTYIRTLVKKGELSRVRTLLNRPVSILGIVIKGSFFARKLGFPTANINPHHEVIPPSGVYAVRIFLAGKKFKGVCYIGTNPTLELKRPLHVEVHIFNFHQNIYGKNLELQFLQKIRKEKRFSSSNPLIEQINKDITFAKNLFSRHSDTPQYMPAH